MATENTEAQTITTLDLLKTGRELLRVKLDEGIKATYQEMAIWINFDIALHQTIAAMEDQDKKIKESAKAAQ